MWVADCTYVATWRGLVYVAFFIDVFSRCIVGWRAHTTMQTDLVLDALSRPCTPSARGTPGGPLEPRLAISFDAVHRSLGRGSPGALVGSVSDAYDYALAESVIGLFKTEVIHPNGPWRGFEDGEMATLEWIA